MKYILIIYDKVNDTEEKQYFSNFKSARLYAKNIKDENNDIVIKYNNETILTMNDENIDEFKMDYKLQKYYENIFTEIHESISDYETLEIGIEIIKIARERLNGDLNNKAIRTEYKRLGAIIRELEEIINNYV